MSLTTDGLYFSKINDNQILDFIPLIEVTKFELLADVGDMFEPESRGLVLCVRVVGEGHNSGKSTVFKFQNFASRDEWLEELESARNDAFKIKERLEVQVS